MARIRAVRGTIRRSRITSTASSSSSEASTLGMWVFLVTEVMFFGGLFLAYIVYRTWLPADAFAAAASHLDVIARRRSTRPC